MSTYKDTDPCTDIILDFISGPESSGNYNAYFGAINSTVPLITYTIAEIYLFQDRLYSSNGKSTATGRYQFLKGTLQETVASVGVSASAIFSPEMQDRLAVERMVAVRGYSAWYRGQIANDDLAHRFALEWASLPDPMNGGRSAYEGDAVGNHAGTTLAAVYAMLTRARAAQTIPAAAPLTPSVQRLVEIAIGQTMYADEVRAIAARL